MAEEVKIVQEFGLKNKKEIWKTKATVQKLRASARNLFTKTGQDTERSKVELLGKLYRMGLLAEDASLDDVLGITVENLLERRLQTQVYKKGLARTTKQARQLVVHGHVLVGGNRETVPSFIVPRMFEDKIEFSPNSDLSDKKHPLRLVIERTTAEAADGKESIDKEAERIKKESVQKESAEKGKAETTTAAVATDAAAKETTAEPASVPVPVPEGSEKSAGKETAAETVASVVEGEEEEELKGE